MRTRDIIAFTAIVVLTLPATSCRQEEPGMSREEILRLNPRLTKVLEHYGEDSLKLKAAEYLIDNLPYHGGATYTDMSPQEMTYQLFGTGKCSPQAAKDSVKKIYGVSDHFKLNTSSDIYIDPGFLINNIDWAFKVWQEQPWGKNVPFDRFCEQILPYRIGNEELYAWREKIYRQFMPIIDSIPDDSLKTSPTHVATVLLDTLLRAPFHFTEEIASDVRIGPKIVDTRGGSCLDLADMIVYIYRALGVPCGIDIMPVRGNNNAPHYVNFTQDADGKSYYFSMFYWWHRLLETKVYGDVYGKFFRQTFAVNKKMMAEMGLPPDSVHPVFRYPCFEDVTRLYADNKAMCLKIKPSMMNRKMKKGDVVYLCMSQRLSWTPVGWSKYEGKKLVFPDCHEGTVFCLGMYDAPTDKLVMVSHPFTFDSKTRKFRFFAPNDKKRDVTLLSKFGMIGEFFLGRMKGGVFEASNNPDFRGADTLHVINEAPVRLCTTVMINSDKKYRYVRYSGPDGGWCNVSEVEFYEPDSLAALKGKIIGSKDGENGDHSYFNVFDGSTETSYDHPNANGGWAGLDLGEKKKIGRIVYSPRNRDNFVRKGDTYELFVCDGGNWVSQGVQVSKSDSLLYKDVPENALFLLSNHTRGVAERLFEYKDGKQIFW